MPDIPTIVDTAHTIAQLRLSPFNVRTDERDTSATEALEASILERGLMQPICVHLMRGGTDKWGVFAGGRRYRSIRKLIERGELPAEWPVPVREYVGYSEAQLIEQSIAENMLRRDLRDYELYAGVRSANARGESVDAIAAALGQEPAKVRRWLRMGELAPPIFAAFKADEITLDEAQAYAATADQALQLSAFEQLQARHRYERTADKIRSALKVGDVEDGRRLRFVGENAYRDAGGGFELDLFAGDAAQRGRVVDEGILRKLVDDKLGLTRDDLRRRTGRPELRFVAQPPRREEHGGGTDYQLQIYPDAGDDDAIALPEGDVVARIAISEAGEPFVDWWWASRKAKLEREKAGKKSQPDRPGRVSPGAAIGHSYDGARQKADAAIKEEAGLTQEAVQVFRHLRQAILRAALVDAARHDRAIGRDYLVWGLLRMLLGSERGGQVGMRSLAAPAWMSDDFNGAEAAREHVAATRAAREWDAALAELRSQPFLESKDLPVAFLAYQAAPIALKNLAAAVVAGLALERSLNFDGYQIPLHDTVASLAQTSADRAIRDIWAPTEALIAMLPKSQQLAIAEPFVESATFGAWSRLKAVEITPLVAGTLDGTGPAIRKSLKETALRWVHPLLRFRAAPAAERVAAAAAEVTA